MTRSRRKAPAAQPAAAPARQTWPERMFVVMVARRFDFVPVGLLSKVLPVEIDARPAIGYLPVYATREDAEREHPGKPIWEISANAAP